MELDDLIDFIEEWRSHHVKMAQNLSIQGAVLFHDQATKFHDVIKALRELETCRQERDDYKRRLDVWCSTAEQYREQSYRLEQKVENRQKVIKEFDILIAESFGVSGLHHNGDIADWSWLMENGWLTDYKELENLND